MQEILSQLLKDMFPSEFSRQYLYSWELIIKTKKEERKGTGIMEIERQLASLFSFTLDRSYSCIQRLQSNGVEKPVAGCRCPCP